jgi:Na+-driven multidrug efflux pump
LDQSVTANTKVGVGTLLNLAWPIILARATQAVIGFTDALLTAPLGEDASHCSRSCSFCGFDREGGKGLI